MKKTIKICIVIGIILLGMFMYWFFFGNPWYERSYTHITGNLSITANGEDVDISTVEYECVNGTDWFNMNEEQESRGSMKFDIYGDEKDLYVITFRIPKEALKNVDFSGEELAYKVAVVLIEGTDINIDLSIDIAKEDGKWISTFRTIQSPRNDPASGKLVKKTDIEKTTEADVYYGP